MNTEIATADVATLQLPENIPDLTAIFAPAAPQLHPSQHGPRLVAAATPATLTNAPALSAAARAAVITDCVETAFGSLVLAGALLFAAGLLRLFWVNGQTANAGLVDAARITYGIAGAIGCVTIYGAGRAIYHLARR